jgi:hypothetical protein
MCEVGGGIFYEVGQVLEVASSCDIFADRNDCNNGSSKTSCGWILDECRRRN